MRSAYLVCYRVTVLRSSKRFYTQFCLVSFYWYRVGSVRTCSQLERITIVCENDYIVRFIQLGKQVHDRTLMYVTAHACMEHVLIQI